jgi:hypothetical protein
MNRIKDAQKRVAQFHQTFQEQMNLPQLDVTSIRQLKTVLDKIYRFEHRCTLKKIKYSEPVCIEFRGAIADLMLLLDNFDLQEAIANRDNNTQTKNIGSVA